MVDLSKWGPLTGIIVAIVLLPIIAGSVLVIVHPDTLTFDQLLKVIPLYVAGLATLGVAHGLVHVGNKIEAASDAHAEQKAADRVVAATRSDRFDGVLQMRSAVDSLDERVSKVESRAAAVPAAVPARPRVRKPATKKATSA